MLKNPVKFLPRGA